LGGSNAIGSATPTDSQFLVIFALFCVVALRSGDQLWSRSGGYLGMIGRSEEDSFSQKSAKITKTNPFDLQAAQVSTYMKSFPD
jgi:hypothetical protein